MRVIKIETIKRKVEQKIRDPRRQYGNILHKLWEMVIIALLSVICKGDDYGDMEEFGKRKEKWLREELGLEIENGIPSEDTFRRLFESMNVFVIEMSCVGETRAAQLIAEIGDINRFDSKKSLTGFAGVDSPAYLSGTVDRQGEPVRVCVKRCVSEVRQNSTDKKNLLRPDKAFRVFS